MRTRSTIAGGLFLGVVLGSAGCGDLPSIDADRAAEVDSVSAIQSPLGEPAGYYNAVDPSSGAALRASLHAVIDDHTRFPYTSTATDTWNVLEAAQEDPTHSGNILDLYGNASFQKQGGGNTLYNREHTWPSSYGFPNDGSQNYPFTDCHHLFLSDDGYNSSRSNKPFRTCGAACNEKPTALTNGLGGGSGVYPGNSNWTQGSYTAGTWEVWGGRRGDVARALFYMDVRYEGGSHGVTGAPEPNLILTDNEAQIASSNTGSNEPVAYMGIRSVLLQWHASDPVDDLERARNDVVYGFQGNRNPFVDHPEWVDCVFNGVCGGGGGGGGCASAADCDDGLFCNGAESCAGGACAAGSDPCGGSTCDEAANACTISGPACGNGTCEPGESCKSCQSDCSGVLTGKASKQYCCGNGVLEGPESDGRCDGNP
jgi:endonuclease I